MRTPCCEFAKQRNPVEHVPIELSLPFMMSAILLLDGVVADLVSNMGVSKNRGTPKWMVYDGKPY